MSKLTLKKKVNKTNPLYVALFAILLTYTIAMFLLLLWAVITSLKFQIDFRTNVLGFPSEKFGWAFENFSIVFSKFQSIVISNGQQKYVDFWGMLTNTMLYAGVGSIISAFVPCIVAYVTAKFDYKFNTVLYGIVIVAMVLPIVGSAPSEMQILKELGIYNTIWGNWIQKFHFLGMYFLVYYAAFKSFPSTYMEAAYIDGASEAHVFFKVVFPLVRNTFFTVLVIKFIELWNDYQSPLLYLPGYPTLAVGLFNLGNSTVGELSWVPRKMAACIILLIPVLSLFIAFKDKLMGNLTMGGIKE